MSVTTARPTPDTTVALHLTVAEALSVHAYLCLGLQHRKANGVTRRCALEVLTFIEAVLEGAGVEPPMHGWRGDLP